MAVKMKKSSDAIMIVSFLLVVSFGFWWLISPSKELTLVNASLVGDTNAVFMLAKDGANINWRSKQTGKTALIVAASYGKAEVVNILLRLGADINIKDNLGKTAGDYAASGGWTNLTKLLSTNSMISNQVDFTRQPKP